MFFFLQKSEEIYEIQSDFEIVFNIDAQKWFFG